MKDISTIIYVGISRAINDLSLYIKLRSNQKDVFKIGFDKALKEYMRVNNITEPFYEFIDK